MKERIKSFLVFTSAAYRVIAFAAVPVFGILFGCLVAALIGLPGYFVTVFLMISIELGLDYMIFGGICAKEVEHLEYVKCSPKGERVVRYALIGGVIRTFVTLVVVFVGNAVSARLLNLEPVGEKETAILIFLLFSSFAVIHLTELAGRFMDSFSIYNLLMCAAMLAEALWVWFLGRQLYIGIAVSVLAAAGAGAGSVYTAMRHIKESYYDKTVTDGN